MNGEPNISANTRQRNTPRVSKLFKNVPFVTSFKMSPFLFSDSLFLS